MAIEIARGSDAAAGAPGTVSRGRSGASDRSDATGSFGAVLASMDEAPVADASPAPKGKASDAAEEPRKKAGDGGTPTDALAANAATGAATAAAPVAVAPPPDTVAGTLPSSAVPVPAAVDPSTLLLAQSTLTAVGVMPPPVRDTATATTASDATVVGGVTAGVGRVGESAVAPEAPGLPTAPLAARPAATPPGVAKDTGTVDTPSAALAVNLLGRADGRKEGARDPLRTNATLPDAGTVAATRQAATASSAAAAATEAAATARAVAPAVDATAAVPAIAAALASETPSPWRRLERAPDGASTHAGLAAGGNDTAFAASPTVAAPDASGGGAFASGAGFTERLVEQVSWWMANRSQGAELKLDLPGGAPVSVTVQVTGNEAHVAFRSDSPEARQWLGAALPQLKEMFGNEGLMLSGASVGQSGTGAEQEAARDAQRALRTGTPTGGAGGIDSVAAPVARPRTATERALDLYV